MKIYKLFFLRVIFFFEKIFIFASSNDQDPFDIMREDNKHIKIRLL